MNAKRSLITRSNIHELTSDDILSFSSKEYWHKFILENAGLYEKEAVLQAVLHSISPFDLVPVKYTVEGKNAYFLARNCGQAIEKFCLNLLLPIQLKNPSGEFSVSIELCSISINEYQMNMQFHLKKAIEKRYDKNQKGFISLSAFHKEPELYEVLFCPLSRPKFFVYVLSILRKILPITAIDLSNNNIEALTPLEILRGFDGLYSVNLSNNKIKDINLSEVLHKCVPDLQELRLNGNPVCNSFATELKYIKWITDRNRCVKKLDGISINNGLPNQQVYLCTNAVHEIVNEFLKHYFTLYDDNRDALQHTYHPKAIFSISFGVSSKNDAKLEYYKSHGRNLLLTLYNKKVYGRAHLKIENIMKVLRKLPLTEHDPYSFKVDVLFYKEPHLTLTVSGIFKDFQEASRVRSFSRTFALQRVSIEEFKIRNDMLYVTNASPSEVKASFKHSKQPADQIKEGESLVTIEEKSNLIELVSKLTDMNSAFSKKCLEECKWNLKKALEVFLDNFEASSIPEEAFAKNFST